jgi:hypothetical protein
MMRDPREQDYYARYARYGAVIDVMPRHGATPPDYRQPPSPF